MNILVTGCAGFIGYHLVNKLLKKKNYKIYGIDNLNNYYDVKLKKNRLANLKRNQKFKFYKNDITNLKFVEKNFKENKYDIVFHLAAQAGVRYSFFRPSIYIDTNIFGFLNVIEVCRKNKIKHFIFASSSSVYGGLKKYPFKENQKLENPISLYASTKLENESIAKLYSKNFALPCTAIRFFTVYGPFGRPDMSLYKFVENITKNKTIELFNNGNHYRDFTYIDDAIEYLNKILNKIPNSNNSFRVFNIASGKPTKILNYIKIIEDKLGLKANVVCKERQKGDVFKTHADVTKISKFTNYHPKTDLSKGIEKFINWYNHYLSI
tara:strand:+ start:275 stop:1243 length:969 start_codon:yes stop_codon:yes gene_type:complete